MGALIAAVTAALVAYVTVKLTAPPPPAQHLQPPPPATQRLTGSDHLEFPAGETPTEKVVYYVTPFGRRPI